MFTFFLEKYLIFSYIFLTGDISTFFLSDLLQSSDLPKRIHLPDFSQVKWSDLISWLKRIILSRESGRGP